MNGELGHIDKNNNSHGLGALKCFKALSRLARLDKKSIFVNLSLKN